MDQFPDRPKTDSPRPLLAVWPFARRYRGRIAIALVFLILGAALTLALPAAVKLMIDQGFASDNQAVVDRYFLVLFGLAFAMAVTVGLRHYYVSWLGERVVADIRKAVYAKVIAMDPQFFEEVRTGEVVSRLNTDTTLVQTVVGSSASIALRSSITLIGAAALLVVTNPGLAGRMGLVIPMVMLPMILLGRWVRKLSRESQDRVADFSSHAQESINAVQTVQSFSQEARESAEFATAVERAFATARRRIQANVVLAISVVTLTFGAVVLVMWLGASQVITGEMSAGELSQFVLYAVLAAGAAGALTEVYGEVQRAAGAMERLAELLSARPGIDAPPQPAALPQHVEGRIEFDQVRFSYPGRPEVPALNRVSFLIEPGQTVALVGPSGAGKSTVFALLMRFYDPQEGAVRIDGMCIDQWQPSQLRSLLGVVPQDTVIFSRDARHNIAYGRPNAAIDEVVQAARAGHAAEFVEELPQGYDTFLGERGVRLSGGQRQRLSISRALLTDPPILLLDEATSALDAESERLVQQALSENAGQRTTLVIAHRLATVRRADLILVFDRGKLVAQGTHASLRETSSLYRHLAELQFGV